LSGKYPLQNVRKYTTIIIKPPCRGHVNNTEKDCFYNHLQKKIQQGCGVFETEGMGGRKTHEYFGPFCIVNVNGMDNCYRGNAGLKSHLRPSLTWMENVQCFRKTV
jgi:hypothetical protein